MAIKLVVFDAEKTSTCMQSILSTLSKEGINIKPPERLYVDNRD